METTTTLVMPGTHVPGIGVAGSSASALVRVWRQRPFAFVALGGIPTDNSTRVSAAGGP